MIKEEDLGSCFIRNASWLGLLGFLGAKGRKDIQQIYENKRKKKQIHTKGKKRQMNESQSKKKLQC